jgi:hypothetical protein
VTSLIRSLIPARPDVRASASPLAFDDWVGMFGAGSIFPMLFNTLGSKEEEIGATFTALQSAMRTNGVVFTCEAIRLSLFSQARFMYRQRRSGVPGDLFSNERLRILERPEGTPGSTTSGMLKRAMLHADYGGTAVLARRGDKIRQPRPDWITFILGSESDPDLTGDDIDAELIGVLYHPGGRYSDQKPVALLPEQVATFVPFPDPVAKVRGIPWTAAITRNVMGHNAATTHKLKFFENGATPQVIVSLDKDIKDPAKFRQWVEVLDQDHKGVTNAYKTLYLGAGAQATVVGKDLKELDFKAVQGADETLIAAAAGVGPVVAQLSEGLQGASLNSGNFKEAMRRVADITMRDLWRDMAGSLEVLAPPPSDAELWYDDRDIPALKDDIRDAAEVRAKDAQAIRNLSDAGAEWDAVIDAVVSGDLKRLRGRHTGLYSVQLQKPGAPTPTSAPAAASVSTVDLPLLAAGEPEWVHCSGMRGDQPCNAKVGKRHGPEPVGFEVKCHQCGTLVAA